MNNCKYRLKRSVLSLLLSSALWGGPLHASGIPTIDVANLVQQLTQYMQMMKEYDEILQQTGLSQDQLMNALQQYQQMMQEYEHLLRQAERLKSRMDKKQWARFWKEANQAYQHRPFEGVDMRAASFGLIKKGVDEADSRYGHVDDQHTMQQQANDVIGYVPDTLNRSYQRTNMGVQQRVLLSQYQQENADSRRRIQATDSSRLTLGDESELATLQLLVEQNQILIGQMAQLNEMQAARFDSLNQTENEHNVNRYKAQMQKIQHAKDTLQQGVTIDESPMRP